ARPAPPARREPPRSRDRCRATTAPRGRATAPRGSDWSRPRRRRGSRFDGAFSCVPSGSVPSSASASLCAAWRQGPVRKLVRGITVCGHSGCGAMTGLVRGREKVATPHLKSWLRHAERALERIPDRTAPGAADELSQANALLQLDHLRSYDLVARAEKEGRLRLHAFWFDIANAEVLAHDPEQGRYVPLDEAQAERLLRPDEK